MDNSSSRAGLSLIVSLFLVACSNDMPADHEITPERSALAGIGPAGVAELEAQIDHIKARLTVGDIDPAEISRLIAQTNDLYKTRALLASYTTAPTISPARQATPTEVAKREALRARMKEFDMNTPADVERWAALKRAELGQ